MVEVTLVKSVQKQWRCSCDLCSKPLIKKGEMMIREFYNRWHQEVYCLLHGKDIIKEKIKETEEIIISINDPEYYIKFISD